LLVLCGAFVLTPVATSLLNPQSAGQVRRLSALQLASWDAKATTDAATTTTSPAPDLDVGALVWAASPFFVPPPPSPTASAQVAAPPVVAAAGGAKLPPPANKATRRRSQNGQASWYQIHNGTCAHKTLPKGTLVRVVNMANKKELICRVADRGPYPEGRIIDLDLEGFKQLANRSEGLIDVRINW
jgi:rare lipoprotein A (peptidoglycan hydrolase)